MYCQLRHDMCYVLYSVHYTALYYVILYFVLKPVENKIYMYYHGPMKMILNHFNHHPSPSEIHYYTGWPKKKHGTVYFRL